MSSSSSEIIVRSGARSSRPAAAPSRSVEGGPDQDGERLDSLAIVRLLEHAVSKNPDLTVERFCTMLGLNYRRVLRACMKHRGTKPSELLRKLRLNAARAELMAGQRSVKEVAWRHGFGREIGRFAGYYRRAFEELPSDTLRFGRSTAG